jgi:hypothetical protein
MMGFQSQEALKRRVAIGVLVSSAIATIKNGAHASVRSIAVTDLFAHQSLQHRRRSTTPNTVENIAGLLNGGKDGSALPLPAPPQGVYISASRWF